MLIGTLQIQNDSKTKSYAIYQGPKHKNFRVTVGPESVAAIWVQDSYGRTFFRAKPQGGGANKDLIIASNCNKSKIIWVLPNNVATKCP